MKVDPLTAQLTSYRAALGISQSAVGRRLKVDRKTVYAWEVGRTRMPLPMAAEYARMVGARLAVVVDEDGAAA